MKKNYLKLLKISLVMSVLSFVNLNAQTTLIAGDIAFTGYIGHGTGATAIDDFSFVLLKDITTGTIINFTENGWLSTNVFRAGENTLVWTATSNLATGTEITIIGTTTTTRLPGGAAGTAGTITGTAFALSANGDQVIAYQGTAATPTFISAIHMNVYVLTNVPDPSTTNDAVWDGVANTSNSSALPTGLTTGVNAIWIGVVGDINSEKDNAKFNGAAFDLSTVAKIKALVYNKGNWITSDNEPVGFSLPTAYGYMQPFLSTASFNQDNKATIYPNPFLNNISVESAMTIDTVEIFDVLGQTVYNKAFTTNINTNNLNSGLYFLKLNTTDGQTIVKKIVKN